jgi:hypothetical protein
MNKKLIVLLIALAALAAGALIACGQTGGFGVGGNVSFFGAGS